MEFINSTLWKDFTSNFVSYHLHFVISYLMNWLIERGRYCTSCRVLSRLKIQVRRCIAHMASRVSLRCALSGVDRRWRCCFAVHARRIMSYDLRVFHPISSRSKNHLDRSEGIATYISRQHGSMLPLGHFALHCCITSAVSIKKEFSLLLLCT